MLSAIFQALRRISGTDGSGQTLSCHRFLCRRLSILSLIACLLAVAAPTYAATDLGAANPYNVFIFGNDSQTGSDSQGRVAVGGNFTISSYDVAGNYSGGNALVVGGITETTYGQIHGSVVSGGAVKLHGPTVYGNVAGNTTVTFDQYGTVNGNVVYGTSYNKNTTTVSGTATQGTTTLPVNFSTAQTQLTNLSSTCAGYAANGTTTIAFGGITLTGTKSGLNVFSVAASSINSANGLTINVPSGSTALVNISGGSVTFQNFGITLNGVDARHVVYNCSSATSITINGFGMLGSLLAPQAAVNFPSGNINGTLIAASLTGSGQENDYGFAGDLSGTPALPTITSLTVSPSSVTGGTSSTGTVTLSGAAPSGGASVTLTSTSGSANPGTTVTVAAGSTTATFPITTTAVSSAVTATITASYNSTSATAPLKVNAPALKSVSLPATSVIGRHTATGKVTLSVPAGTGGVKVTLG